MQKSKEFRIVGPPGTGKTTTLSCLIAKSCSQHGSEAVLVTSFTKAAARELVSRNLPLNEDRIGTLHALCYRALDRPKLVDRELLKDWNASYPAMQFGGIGTNVDDPYGDIDSSGAKDGDGLLQELNRLRGLQIQPDFWPIRIQNFQQYWADFKDQTFTIDFTDLIARCFDERLPIPHDSRVMFLDEVQDFSPLELSLARWWGSSCDELYLGGDDDQVLYRFKGAIPDAFLSPQLPADQVTILAQSYRVPRAVHAAATAWIESVETRIPKDYQPRAFDGCVDQLGVTYKWVEPLKDRIEEWIDQGKTVALLASCSFFLDPLKHKLREWGVPFWNPYRKTRGDWNPLTGRSGTISASDRVRMYRKPVDDDQWWTYRELWEWAGCLKAEDLFHRGAKTLMRRKGEGEETAGLSVAVEDLEAWFADPVAAEMATAGDVSWLQSNLLETYRKPIGYACNILEARGAKALKQQPQVILGTIHCSPGDEPVLTTEGFVPIGQLDPNKHRLASYMEGCNRLVWGGLNGKRGEDRKNMGYPFALARQPYKGNMLTISTNGSRTRVTPNHRMQVRFAESFFNKWIVYLMRRGNWWRVGFCTSGKRPYQSGGLKGRMATERADAGWILGVFDSAREAVTEEMKIQCEYGIPGLTFEACKSRSFRSDELHSIHESLRMIVSQRAQSLLRDRGLLEESPLCVRGEGVRVNHRSMFTTQAANLIDRYMEIPVIPEGFCERMRAYNKKPMWFPLAVTTETEWEGDVFSLDVRPHHHYISGNAVVHNSVKGGEADIVVLFPDLSPSGYQEWSTPGEARDSVRRCFYVGMTRAKEELYWAQPVGMSIGGYL